MAIGDGGKGNPREVAVGLPTATRQYLVGASIVVFAVGTIALFSTDQAAATAALTGSSLVLLLVAVFGDRVTSIEAAGIKFAVAAEQAADEGRDDEAARLRRLSKHLLDSSGRMATQYELVRESQPSSWARTSELERLLQRAQALAGLQGMNESLVVSMFDSEGVGNRIISIAIMEANPSLANLDRLSLAIAAPSSDFEEYHALRALLLWLEQSEGALPDSLVSVLESGAGSLASGESPNDRSHVARRILELHKSRAGTSEPGTGWQ